MKPLMKITSFGIVFTIFIFSMAFFEPLNAGRVYEEPTKIIQSAKKKKDLSIRSPPKKAMVQTRKKVAKKKPSKSAKVSKEDVMNLARIIHAENGGHPNDEALILTGVVVLKRVKSKQFPNTIMGVVSQKGQYATWMDGKFYCKPSKRSIKIARRLLTTDLADKYPDSLIYQAEFPQGSKVYKKLGFEYFCLE